MTFKHFFAKSITVIGEVMNPVKIDRFKVSCPRFTPTNIVACSGFSEE